MAYRVPSINRRKKTFAQINFLRPAIELLLAVNPFHPTGPLLAPKLITLIN